ncbi:MAG: OsmC family protein [Candidatus Krumholzibacteriia bacterium]
MTTATATWAGGLRFVGEADSGHLVIMDAPGSDGEDPQAPTPVEHTLIALCACTGIDVASILRKMKIPFRALEVSAEAERAPGHPRVFTKIRLKYRVGGDVPEDKLRRAIELSESTYCTVGAMLHAVAEITHEFEITP